MMSLRDINAAADALCNLLQAGSSNERLFQRLAQIQPMHAEFWKKTEVSVVSGKRLSESLIEVWPATVVNAVVAGEVSGKLEDAFFRIEETTTLQMNLRKSMFKIAYPVGAALAGIAIFIGYMMFVLPSIAIATGKQSTSGIMQLSMSMSTFFNENWMALLVAILIGVAMLVAWARTPQAQTSMLNSLLFVPVVKDAFRDLYFGLWANYMAMMSAAGIATARGLKLTEVILPEVMRESVAVFGRDMDINSRSMSDSADLSKQPVDDERVKWWPFYISQAFIMADATGEVDKALLKVAHPLIKEGTKKLDRVIFLATTLALAFAAALIMAPMVAYYAEMGNTLSQSGF